MNDTILNKQKTYRKKRFAKYGPTLMKVIENPSFVYQNRQISRSMGI